MQTVPVAITLLSAVYLAVCILVFGRRLPNYRHIQHTISELGEFGSPFQRAVAYGVFLPVGLALALVALLTAPHAQATAALAACIAVGYLTAAAFPCDPGSPASGTARQGIHNLGGAVEYLGGGAALLAIAEAQGVGLLRMVGMSVFAAAALLTVLPARSVRGLVQRLAEAGLFGGLVIAMNA